MSCFVVRYGRDCSWNFKQTFELLKVHCSFVFTINVSKGFLNVLPATTNLKVVDKNLSIKLRPRCFIKQQWEKEKAQKTEYMLFVESACKRYMSDKWSLKSVFTWRHGAMLVSQTSPVGVELFPYVNSFFCSNKFARLLVTRVKTLYSFPAGICQVTSLLLHKQKGYWLITKGKIHHFTCYMLQQEFPP